MSVPAGAEFRLLSRQGHLHCRPHLPVQIRFQDVSVRPHGPGPEEGFLVAVRGDQHDGDAQFFLDTATRLDAVHGPGHDDVHEHQVGMKLPGPFQGLRAGGGLARHLVPQRHQESRQLVQDDRLVVRHQDGSHGHSPISLNSTSASVPDTDLRRNSPCNW